jgi:hypothetical protein
VFNATYHRRARKAIKEAGGGHQLAADQALRLPWGGIFEPWRPFVLTAAAAETVQRRKAANRCKKGSGRLQGVQLDLFADLPPKPGKSPADSAFPSLVEMFVPMTDDELAADFEKKFPL